MIKILIVDDHALVREGLKRIIADDSGMRVSAEAKSGPECLERVRAGTIDVVLLDVSLPGRNGLEALKVLKGESPKLPVLMLSMHSEEEFALRALKAGASGYLTKDTITSELLQAIRKVSKGERFITPRTAGLLASYVGAESSEEPHERLSDREYEVMCLLASGMTTREISRDLSLSISAVSTYRRCILNKMGLKSNAEITRYAVEHHLITPLSL